MLEDILSRIVVAVSKSTLLVGLWKASASHWRNALWWSLCNLGGGLAPVWTAIFLRRLFSHPANLPSFFQHGDVALYAAAFLAPSIFQIAIRMKRDSSVLQTGALISAALVLVFSALIFTSVSPELSVKGSTVNERLLYGSSGLVFIFSYLLAICVFLNEAQLESPDVGASEMVDQVILSGSLQLRHPTVAPGLITPPPEVPDFEVNEENLRMKFEEGDNRNG